MTQCLQDFIYASEDFKGKSEKLAQSIEINSFLLADGSTEKEIKKIKQPVKGR